MTSVVEVPVPTAGPAVVLVKIRACGICGSDAMNIAIGGLPGREGRTPLGHEPAAEVVAVGSDVVGVSVGDHVVVNP
ncbi:alcohol dehydrogenase catalytic domain-containing protein, partial [Agreia sp. PsM10]